MDSSLARDLVRAAQVSTLREMATLYARANDLSMTPPWPWRSTPKH
jgi:hypothetical protein